MSRKAIYVSVNPSVMKWARESSGRDFKDVKKRLDISVDTIKEWEQRELGAKKPTLNTLKKLATFYKRPLAVFFLPARPQEPSLPTDFRFLPVEKRHPLSMKARLAVRRARRLQSLATEMMEDFGDKPFAKIGSVSLTEDPEAVASRERDRLSVSIEDQLVFKSDYDAFNRWREALENLNILVLQARIPPEEARGFSLLNHLLPTIIVSISDYIRARIFTLFHEYAHLILGTSGICFPHEAPQEDANKHEIERFCDHFAGALLVPKHALQQDDNVKQIIRGTTNVDDYLLYEIASHFKVSKAVILRRLLYCELITRDQYSRALLDLQARKKVKGKSFGLPPAKRCVAEGGQFFVSLALEAKERDLVTYSDLADYLSIKVKHLDKLEALLQR